MTADPPQTPDRKDAAANPESPVSYRWSLAGIDPDDAHRAVRRANAVVSWADPGRTLYQLADCRVEVADFPTAVLLIDGPDEDAVRAAAARLGYRDLDGTVSTLDNLPVAAW
jgi:hypothetical protein